jgi:hypothetical protein
MVFFQSCEYRDGVAALVAFSRRQHVSRGRVDGMPTFLLKCFGDAVENGFSWTNAE